MKRYAVEQDSPDGGRSTHAECWGHNGRRGRVLSENDSLEAALVDCQGASHTGLVDSCTWIWDRLRARRVSRRQIERAGGAVSKGFLRFFPEAA